MCTWDTLQVTFSPCGRALGWKLVGWEFESHAVVSLFPADVISAPIVALFKKNLDDLWRTTRYGHSQRPAA